MVTVDVIQARTISKKATKYLSSRNPVVIPGPVLTQGFADSINNLIAAQMAPILKHTLTSYDLSVSKKSMGGTPTVQVKPRKIKKDRKGVAGFFAHVGGFALLSADDYNAYRMASDLGIVVYSVDYSLSPSAKFPVALHQTVKAYDAMAKKYGEVLAVGSSVGAN